MDANFASKTNVFQFIHIFNFRGLFCKSLISGIDILNKYYYYYLGEASS